MKTLEQQLRAISNPDKRHDVVFFLYVENSNPNGDPDNGNAPRMNPFLSTAIVTDACLKRKGRNYVADRKAGEEGFEIFISRGEVLKRKLDSATRLAAAALDLDPDEKNKAKEAAQKRQIGEVARLAIIAKYWDVRMFGGLLSTKSEMEGVPSEAKEENPDDTRTEKQKKSDKDKQTKKITVHIPNNHGPLQVSIGESINITNPISNSITRVVSTTDEEKSREMGERTFLDRAMIRFVISYSPCLATIVSEEDLYLFWSGLVFGYDADDSSNRVGQLPVGIFGFTHDNSYGNAPRSMLLGRITPKALIEDITSAPIGTFPYKIDMDMEKLPEGVTGWRIDTLYNPNTQ